MGSLLVNVRDDRIDILEPALKPVVIIIDHLFRASSNDGDGAFDAVINV